MVISHSNSPPSASIRQLSSISYLCRSLPPLCLCLSLSLSLSLYLSVCINPVSLFLCMSLPRLAPCLFVCVSLSVPVLDVFTSATTAVRSACGKSLTSGQRALCISCGGGRVGIHGFSRRYGQLPIQIAEFRLNALTLLCLCDGVVRLVSCLSVFVCWYIPLLNGFTSATAVESLHL